MGILDEFYSLRDEMFVLMIKGLKYLTGRKTISHNLAHS